MIIFVIIFQGGHHLSSNQQGRAYRLEHGYRGYNDQDGEPLFYNSRPRDYKEYSRYMKNYLICYNLSYYFLKKAALQNNSKSTLISQS